MCFHERRRYGANARIAKWIIRRLRSRAEDCGFLIFAYCVMPDHIHFLAVGALETSNLIKLVEAFKQDTAIEFSRKTRRPLWQLKYYDHILRESDSIERVAWYIWLNPVRKGLCRAPADTSGAMTPSMNALFHGLAAAEWLPPWKRLQKVKTCRAKDPGATFKSKPKNASWFR